jgi:hypothetical protein
MLLGDSRQGRLSCPGSLPTQDLLLSPGYLLLLGTLLGPVVVGYSVTILEMKVQGPRCSVSIVPHISLSETNKTTKLTKTVRT